jgi:hypothetical protein
VFREKTSFGSSQKFTSQNVVNNQVQPQKKKTRNLNKEKIPQKLIENRRQEILASLAKVTDQAQTVVKSVPRVSTGSKRGSHFRGVSVNGKKWQVRIHTLQNTV